MPLDLPSLPPAGDAAHSAAPDSLPPAGHREPELERDRRLRRPSARLLRLAAFVVAGVAVLAIGVLWLAGPGAHLLENAGGGALLAAALPVVGVIVARIADVTLGVLRTVFIVSGRRMAAGTVAALETGVWLAAAAVVLDDLTPVKAIAYCVGVGLGTLVGMAVVRAARLGVVTVRVFVPHGCGEQIAGFLRERGLGATVFTGQGRDGPRDMVLSMARRREAAAVQHDLAGVEGAFCLIDTDAVIGTVGGVSGKL